MSSYQGLTTAERKKVVLPDKFLCRICEKPKAHIMYSNKELASYQNKIAAGHMVTWITAKLRCRNCAGEQTMELCCAGPCGMWKPLDEFSKNSRKRGDDAQCWDCISWKEAQEPGIMTGAPPGGMYNRDELDSFRDIGAGSMVTATTTAASTTYGPEGDSDDEDELPATLRSSASEGGDKFFASFNSMNIGSTEPVTSKTVGPKTAASGTGRSLTPRKVSPAGYTIGQAPSPVAASTQQSSVVPGFDPNAYRSAATPCGEPSKGGWARPFNPNGKGGQKSWFTPKAQTGRPGWDPEEEEADHP